MILSCPSCGTRYRVDEDELAGGRTLRCAHCGHSWELEPAPPPPLPEPEAAQREPLPAFEGRVEPPSLPAPSRRIEAPPRPERSGHPVLTAFILLVFLLAVALVLYEGRSKIVALWPPAARFYALVGMGPQPLGAGLEISGVAPKRIPGGLVVEGEVKNTSKIVQEVPALRIALRNAQKQEVVFKIFVPPKKRLLPGESETFSAAFEHPPQDATGLFVTFAGS